MCNSWTKKQYIYTHKYSQIAPQTPTSLKSPPYHPPGGDRDPVGKHCISGYISVCFFDNNIFNFVSVLFIKLLIFLLSIIVYDGNELFKIGIFIGVLSLLLFIHVLHLNITFCDLNN